MVLKLIYAHVIQHVLHMLQIVREGEPATDLFILAHGTVRVIKVSSLISFSLSSLPLLTLRPTGKLPSHLTRSYSFQSLPCLMVEWSSRKNMHASTVCTNVFNSKAVHAGGGSALQDGYTRVHAHTFRNF